MDDTISRQAAILAIEGALYYYSDDKRMAIDAIKELPPAQPEQKTGRWVDGHCSECGCDVPAYIEDWHWVKDMNAKFCPMCGARMTNGE